MPVGARRDGARGATRHIGEHNFCGGDYRAGTVGHGSLNIREARLGPSHHWSKQGCYQAEGYGHTSAKIQDDHFASEERKD